MPVDSTGAARPATAAPEPGGLDLTCQTFEGVRKETVALLYKCDDAIRDRDSWRRVHEDSLRRNISRLLPIASTTIESPGFVKTYLQLT
ncbi:MAG: hypothetical protein NTZ39_09980 [Methanoregula sp.]|nr:hypothetical protein [Methanoregula sp.]